MRQRGAPGRFEAIVFDLDGTVIDSPRLIVQTVQRVVERRALPAVDATAVHALMGLPLDEVFQAVLGPAARYLVPQCVDEYRLLFDAEVLPVIRPIEGAAEALAVAARQGVPLGIATGRRTDTAVAMLERCALAHHFVAVLGTDRVERPKPHPDVLLRLLEGMGGIRAARTLVVGDSTHDVAMARAAGAAACAVTWGAQARVRLASAAPDWCVDRWDELLALLGAGVA